MSTVFAIKGVFFSKHFRRYMRYYNIKHEHYRVTFGLVWNEKKCSIADVKRGALSSDQGGTVVGDAQVISSLK